MLNIDIRALGRSHDGWSRDARQPCICDTTEPCFCDEPIAFVPNDCPDLAGEWECAELPLPRIPGIRGRCETMRFDARHWCSGLTRRRDPNRIGGVS